MKSTSLLMTLLATALLAGCVNTKDTTWVRPIYPTAQDVQVISPQLRNQIITHNETGEQLGLWKP